MDLGSWRSNRGDVAQAVASPIVARNHPVGRRSHSERQRGDNGGTQSAAGHACRHQRACLLTVWQRGFLVRTAWRIVAHHRHGGSRHHAGSRGRGSKRPNSKARDRENREQAMEQRPDLHALMISQFALPGKCTVYVEVTSRRVIVNDNQPSMFFAVRTCSAQPAREAYQASNKVIVKTMTYC
jgi:hypothetical protein